MKTINNVQKTILTATFIFSGLLITVGISAKTELNNNTKAAYQIENVFDNVMAIEDWMISDNYFSTKSIIENVSDELIEIDGWMLDENNFSSKSAALAPTTDVEMEIEGWMTNEYLFKSKADNECIVTLVKDNEMEIEKWMLENYYWK